MPAQENPTIKAHRLRRRRAWLRLHSQRRTEEELLTKVAAHAAHDHGVAEVTPELAAKVKAAIKSR